MGRATLETLRLYVRRTRWSIIRSMRQREEWSADQLSKAQGAFAVLEHHPLCPEVEYGLQYDFLVYVQARFEASEVLRRGLEVFPDSGGLHARLRKQILDQGGDGVLDGLEETYQTMLAQPGASPNLTWFAGYATIVAAEYHRRAGEAELARGSYGRAIELYKRNMEALPENESSAKHYIAICHAGLARLSMEAGDLDAALAFMLTSIETEPLAITASDGLGFTGSMTATTIQARLEEAGDTASAERLKAATSPLPSATR
ncbi:MAG: hypothetical protein KDB61_10775, partial [Planctomycetes bacterium]|nr:hypothetical protein [Planctomycetota bacterium]